MKIFTLVLLCVLGSETLRAQSFESGSRNVFCGITTAAPIYPQLENAFNLTYDKKFLWLKFELGIQTTSRDNNSMVLNIGYQQLPDASMSRILDDYVSSGNRIVSKDSILTRANCPYVNIAYRHQFEHKLPFWYAQFGFKTVLVLNHSQYIHSITTTNTSNNYYSESTEATSAKRKQVFPILSFGMGRKVLDRVKWDTEIGLEANLLLSQRRFSVVGEKFPLPIRQTRITDANGLRITSIFQLNARIRLHY